MTKPIASLSLDLDNKWAYLRTHGVVGWEKYPSYLDVVVPRVIRFCNEHQLSITCFVVGRDASLEKNYEPLMSLAEAGHEIANHSHNHFPWLHTLSRADVETEICLAEEHIESVTGQRPVGFRGPGFSLSSDALEVLAQRGYAYDATTLPTILGPLARWFFRHTASRDAVEQVERCGVFGSLRDGFRPIHPYICETSWGPLAEIPVTTFPFVRLPIHMTYLMYLRQFAPRLAEAYFRMAISTCRLAGIGPSFLLHPLDFLGAEDDSELRFFPGMKVPLAVKQQLLHDVISRLQRHFAVRPVLAHAAALQPDTARQAPAHVSNESLRVPVSVK